MPAQQRPMLALVLRLCAMLVLSSMLLLVKLSGERGIWLPEMLFWRQLIPGVIILFWLTGRGELRRLRTQRLWIHARRAFIGGTGMFLTLGVVQILPLAEATVLGFTAPIFAVILSALFLGERVGVWRWSAVVLGLIGIVIIAGPDRAQMSVLGLCVGIGGAFMVALISIQLRDLGRTEEPITIVFWFSAFCAPVLAPFAIWAGAQHDAEGWAMIAGIGVAGLFAQLLMTTALRYGDVASVIVMDYSQLVWATLWGWFIFASLPPPTTWIGAPVVVAAGLIIAWRERRLSLRRTAAPFDA
jgi:drug/metabolite transporter (DMT)-like permease